VTVRQPAGRRTVLLTGSDPVQKCSQNRATRLIPISERAA